MRFSNIRAKFPQLIVLLVIISLIGIRSIENSSKTKGQTVLVANNDILSCLKEIVPEVTAIENDGAEQWILKDKNSITVGKAVIAQQTTSKIIGYSGPIPMVIALDKNDNVKALGLLPNDETPSFIDVVVAKGFLKKWNGLSVNQAVAMDMDAVSGATYSSTAINETVKQRLAEYSKATAVARKADIKMIVTYCSILLVLLYALAFYCFPKQMNKYRITLLILSIGVLGIAYGSFLSIKLIGGWFIQGVSLKNQIIFVTMAILAFMLPFLFGKNFYCTYVCPFGASQELLGKINPKKLELPKSVTTILSHTRTKVMLFVLGIALFGSTIDVTNAEPFTLFLFASASKGVIVMSAAFLLLSIFIPRAWCRFFCPTGALIDFFRKEGKDIFPKKVTFQTHLIALVVAAIAVLIFLASSIFA
ncbi:4Fe-4S binding protein [Acetobacteroides hydrogenigenes]|uniref:4Fe-4S binding protein n=1 Tax=Acetobacteroides hydrogenigenes TaxID=979970 RepID=A0A4R2EMJ2_9BACT|nr:4Fe-4S binding protein [Acetobacteroides hydrogenigenes]TCN68452.1 4Fe-4S binding protein [Acetobacteroides hydrogenigenes]